jgi:hypothetical protein
VNVPCSPTPAGPPRSATTTPRCCLPPNGRRRLPRQILISGLNHTARPPAVYASQGGLLHRHARLASGGWPTLPGGTDYPPGPNERFQVIPSSFPRLPLAHPIQRIEISLVSRLVNKCRLRMLRLIFAADLVQRNGRALSFQSASQPLVAVEGIGALVATAMVGEVGGSALRPRSRAGDQLRHAPARPRTTQFFSVRRRTSFQAEVREAGAGNGNRSRSRNFDLPQVAKRLLRELWRRPDRAL